MLLARHGLLDMSEVAVAERRSDEESLYLAAIKDT